MKRAALIISFLFLLGIGLFFAFRSEPGYANFPPPTGTTWIAFGDSLTSGFGASEGNDYPSLLGKRVGIPILNYSSRPSTGSKDSQSSVVEAFVENASPSAR